MVLATPLLFPAASDGSGDCGQIVFPSGSSPVGGNSVTLQTALQQPGGYPGTIPPGPGNYGVGATAVEPWLTYSVAQTLNTNGQNPRVQVICPPCQQNAFYYIAIFDLTSPSQPIVTFPAPFTALPPTSVGRRPVNSGRQFSHVRLFSPRSLLHRDDLVGGHHYYLGTFSQPDDGNIVIGSGSFNPTPAPMPLPPADGFSGTASYGPFTGGTIPVTLISGNVDFTGGYIPPLQTFGVPIFYEDFFLLSGSSAITFGNTSANGTLLSSSILGGALYDAYWYDWTNVTPSQPAILLLHTSAITASPGSLSFPTLFASGFTFQGEHHIMAEFVKD